MGKKKKGAKKKMTPEELAAQEAEHKRYHDIGAWSCVCVVSAPSRSSSHSNHADEFVLASFGAATDVLDELGQAPFEVRQGREYEFLHRGV